MTVSRDMADGPLAGLRVVDVSTLFAGPMAAMHLGDMGAEVIKVEHPKKPDAARGHGLSKDGVNLWWKTLGRNKRAMTLDLSTPDGAEVFKALAGWADVVIENFRPGTLEKWGVGYDALQAVNPRLVLARVTGFGQFGPYCHRPGFGTLAEAMSGFSALTGEVGGPPTLPPFGLADGVASLAIAYAVMVALRAREVTGRGQQIDLALIEPILALLGPQITRWDQTHTVAPRTGNRSLTNAPRNTYLTKDGEWVAVSASARSVAERVVTLAGRADLAQQPWFATGAGRFAHVDEIDEALSGWIGQHTRDEVLAVFEDAQAAVAPIYDGEDIYNDPQFQALGTVHRIDDPDFGEMAMQGPLFRLSDSDGVIAFTGRAHGADTESVLHDLGFDDARVAQLREAGAI